MTMKRIVVKIGSSSLTNAKGELDYTQIDDHVRAIATLKQAGYEVLLVSSGAVAAGFHKLGYPTRPVTVKGKQAAAAVGQGLLIQLYHERFAAFGITPAQVLLTRTDFLSKERYKNAYATFEVLLERGIIPIINENDTVSVEELTFGDNDMLSALVSGLVHADQCIILTDINGLYTANPTKDPTATQIPTLSAITDEMLGYADNTGSSVGTGGMSSKLLAAKRALDAGVKVFIGRGNGSHKLLEILDGKGDGTYIEHDALAFITNAKQWITLADSKGRIYVDAGAENAMMRNGKSLLPAGITHFEGDFARHDVVEVYGKTGLLGRGEVRYTSKELALALGKRTDEIDNYPIEVIHRNHWVEQEDAQ